GQQDHGAGVVVGAAADPSGLSGEERTGTPVGISALVAGQQAMGAGQQAMAAGQQAVAEGQHAVAGEQALAAAQHAATGELGGYKAVIVGVPEEVVMAGGDASLQEAEEAVASVAAVEAVEGEERVEAVAAVEEVAAVAAVAAVEVPNMAGSASSMLPSWYAETMHSSSSSSISLQASIDTTLSI
ncbi:unnamed protein product, partial [Closterium sp. NIES-53]